MFQDCFEDRQAILVGYMLKRNESLSTVTIDEKNDRTILDILENDDYIDFKIDIMAWIDQELENYKSDYISRSKASEMSLIKEIQAIFDSFFDGANFFHVPRELNSKKMVKASYIK